MLEDRDTWIDPILPEAATALCTPLQETNGGGHTYLLMDACFVPRLAERLEALLPSHEFCSLYEGLYTGQGIEHIAPYLIHLPQAPEERLRTSSGLIALGRGKPILNCLHSDGDLAALTRHFQRQFEAVDEQGQGFLLRFADTRTFPILTTILTPAQRKRLLAGIRRWSYIDRAGAIQTIDSTEEFDESPVSSPYVIDRRQAHQIEALALPDAILRYIQMRPTRLGTLTVSPSAAHAAIRRAIEPAVSATEIDNALAHRLAFAQLRQSGLLSRPSNDATSLP